MIDFHSHIIPNIDDGSESTEMSLEMLRQSTQHGVTDIISTSHCYPRYPQSIDHFIERRTDGIKVLSEAMTQSDMTMPKIHLASEVNLVTDISEFPNLSKLCLENTDYILLEMPYDPWKEWMIDTVYKITLKGLKPIMAHIDRFMLQDASLLNSLFELDVLFQVNAELFIQKQFSKFADNLLSEGHAHLLGSDMHNTAARKPNMNIAYENIIKRYGTECIEYFNENSRKVLNNEPVTQRYFRVPEKQSFFSRLFKK